MRFVGVLASVTLAAVLRACMGLLFAFSGGVARYLARFFFAVSVAVINDNIMHPVFFRSDALGACAVLVSSVCVVFLRCGLTMRLYAAFCTLAPYCLISGFIRLFIAPSGAVRGSGVVRSCYG